MTDANTTAPDPYAPQPSWAEKNPVLAWGGGVFFLTALLTWVAFPPANVGEAGFFMLTPAVLWAYRAPDFRPFAWSVLGAQVVAWIALLGWLHNVTWIGMLLVGALVGLLQGGWFLAVWWAVPRLKSQPPLVRIIGFVSLAALWVAGEWFRGWLFGGFPWLPLAASQWQRPIVLQVASYGGACAVSFLLAFLNLGIAALTHRIVFERAGSRRSPEFMVALLALILATFPLAGEMLGQQRTKLLRVSLVQPYIPQGEKWDPARSRQVLGTIEEVTRAAALDNPEVIVWPETVVPWTLYRDPNVRLWLESLAHRTGTPLLLGSAFTRLAAADGGELWFNGAFVVDPRTGLEEPGYAKRKLVPFGEYVPLRPLLGWMEKFAEIGGDFEPGTDARPLVLPVDGRTVATGTLICYEDIFPALARDSVRGGAELLAVLTNNAWFGEGGAAYQHAAHSVLRAVENRRPLLRVGNGGWSGWIDEYGHIRETAIGVNGTVYFRGHRTVDITRDERWRGRASVYTQRGDWFVLVCGLFVVLGYYLVRPLRSRRAA